MSSPFHRVCLTRRTVSLLASLLCTGALSHAQEVPRALPVEENPVPRAQPVETPTARKALPATDVPKARPTGPDEDLYDYATLCFNQKDYSIAIKPLSDYVKTYPQGRHAAEAWFRLGESHLKTGQADEASRAYNEVMTRHPRTESAASAAYRIGAMVYATKDFTRAASYFEITAKLTTSADVKLASLYNTALCYKQDGNKAKALTAFKAVAAAKDPNQYRESALLEIGASALDTGKKDEALQAFNDLITTTKSDEILGDALIKAGLILNEQGKSEAAMKNFKRALGIATLSNDLRGVATYGLIEGYFLQKDYDNVISTYSANATSLPPESLRAKMYLMVGTAHKEKQNYRQAIEIFVMLEKNYPEAEESLEGGYRKLLCFYQLGDKDMPEFCQRFEERYNDKFPKHEYLRMARLIRADWWFGKGDYKQAADAYSGIDMAKVLEKVRAGVLYKKGFAEAEAGKANDAIGSLSLFLTDYPKDANVPLALAQRGVSYKTVRSFDKALEDFANIIKNHPGHSAAELAYYQSGLIKGETRDFAGMIVDLEALVKKFPNTPAAAEAWYRIGKGYFDTKQKENYAKAIEPLRKSIAADAKEYLDKGSQLLIATQWLREDVDGLATEVDAYLGARKDASITPKALSFLGVNFYNRGNYRSSARYLNLASTPDQPAVTEPVVWEYLGLAELENGNHEAAVKAFDNYLAQTPEGAGRVKAFLNKGRAMLSLGKFDEADGCVTEGLKLTQQGDLHAKLQILQGDIALNHGDAFSASGDQPAALAEWKKAAGNFVVVSQFYVHPDITPEAAYKAVKALDKIGEKEKAEALRKQLKSKYPNYKPV
jgi:TolA-binding protein